MMNDEFRIISEARPLYVPSAVYRLLSTPLTPEPRTLTPSPTPPVIRTQDLTKAYGELRAIDNLTLELARGDVFGFIGPNGSGKTTTMRILATLLQPTWGEAYVCGHSIYTHPKEIRRLIGYMPDFFGVYDDMKVIEYLEFFAAAYRIKGAKRRKVCDDMLELVGPGLQARRPGHEPLPRHDPAPRPGPRAAARSAGAAPGRAGQRPGPPGAHRDPGPACASSRAMGKTIMVSSHILPELADICNKIGIIEHGKLLVSAEVTEVMRQVRRQPILSVGVVGDPDSAAKLLQGHDAVERVNVRDGHLTVALREGTQDYSDLPTLLVQAGFKLILFREEEINLETAFMALTKGITA